MALILQDHDLLPASAILAPSGDYKSVDPITALTLPVTGFDVSCRGGTAIILTINVTAASGGGGVTGTIQGYDEASGVWTTIISTALVVTPSQVQLSVTPWIATSANVNQQKHLPIKCRILLVGSGTRTTLNYSASVILSN